MVSKTNISVIEFWILASQIKSFYIYLERKRFMICLLVYTDDIILAGNDLNQIKRIKVFLHDQLKIKDLGHLKFFMVLKCQEPKKAFICLEGNMQLKY